MRANAFATILALAAAAPLPAAGLREDGEKTIAGLVAGRTAGEPTACIPSLPSNRSWNINRIGVVYEVGATRYVMRFQDGCDQLDQSAFFVTDTPTTQLCRGDIAQVYTNGGPPRIPLGSCVVGRFVPYKKG